MARNGNRKAFERFGGNREIALPDGTVLTIGGLNTAGGTAMLPWRMRRYVKMLGLTAYEMILAEDYLIHQWECGKGVWLSMKKKAELTGFDRMALTRARIGLERKGYIEPIQKRQNGITEYDASPLLHALAICALCDPYGEYAKRNGAPLSESDARAYMKAQGLPFDLNFDAVQQLEQYPMRDMGAA